MIEPVQPTGGLSAVGDAAGRFVPLHVENKRAKDPAERAPETLYSRESAQETPETFKPLKDEHQIPETIRPHKEVEQAPRSRQTQQDEQAGSLPDRLDFALEFQFKGVRFRPIDNPPVIQARIYDRVSREILREVPTADQLRVARAFRENLAEYVGRYLDAAI